jgi:hypothetical protein
LLSPQIGISSMSENKNDDGKKTPIEQIFREIAKREMTPNERTALLPGPKKRRKLRRPK